MQPDQRKDPAPTVDVDSWIREASLPEIEETIYRDGRLIAEIKRVEDELARAPHPAEDRRFASRSVSREALEAELARLVAATGEGALTIRFRAMTDAQRDELSARFKAPTLPDEATDEEKAEHDRAFAAFDRALGAAMLAAQTVSPPISEDQYARMRGVVGDAQMQKLVTACGSVNRMVIGDSSFWRRSSGKTPAS